MATVLASSSPRDSPLRSSYRTLTVPEPEKQSSRSSSVTKMAPKDEKDKKSLARDASSKQLPAYVKTFKAIFGPQDVRMLGLSQQLYDRLFSFYLLKPIGMEESWETFLTHLYKCDVFATNCFFSTNSVEAFKTHCVESHDDNKLFCHYCNEEQVCGEDRDPEEAYNLDELIEHIQTEHENQSHQCNLCYYRAVDRHQVFVHQALEHPRQFTATLLKVLHEKAVEEKLTAFEEHLVENLKDENNAFLAVDDDKPDEADARLKYACILYKPNHKNEGANELDYYNRYAIEMDVNDVKTNVAEEAYYQCAYCSAGTAVTSDDLLVHWCQEHPQVPFLAIDLLVYAASLTDKDPNFAAIAKKELKARDADNNKLVLKLDFQHNEAEDYDNLINMVDAFKSNLVEYRYSRIYSAEFMQKARDAALPKGIKRKHDEEQEAGDLVVLGHRFKRPRTSIIPLWLRASTAARIFGSTAVAFGLYHLGNFAMQNLTNLQH